MTKNNNTSNASPNAIGINNSSQTKTTIQTALEIRPPIMIQYLISIPKMMVGQQKSTKGICQLPPIKVLRISLQI
jgi:hypothetical protein